MRLIDAFIKAAKYFDILICRIVKITRSFPGLVGNRPAVHLYNTVQTAAHNYLLIRAPTLLRYNNSKQRTSFQRLFPRCLGPNTISRSTGVGPLVSEQLVVTTIFVLLFLVRYFTFYITAPRCTVTLTILLYGDNSLGFILMWNES